MSGRGNVQGAFDAGRRMLDDAVEAGIKRAQHGTLKPTLRRYSWSRLHSDLLDDVRWSLVAKRANAPLPFVEAVLIRLENHANRSVPRGYVGDFSAEGMAARWNVEADTIGRILAQLEASDIGWIDQDQIVTFWARNPDLVDETAAERQQRARDKKKAMRQLAAMARAGAITEQVRCEREAALKESREPKTLMAAWAGLSTATVTRDSVTVTTRADHIIKKDVVEKEKRGSPREVTGTDFLADGAGDIVDIGKAQLWLRTQGELVVTARLAVLRTRASLLIARWCAGADNDLVVLVNILRRAIATPAAGAAFETAVENMIAQRAQDAMGPRLPLAVMLEGGKPAAEDHDRHGVTVEPVDNAKRSAG